MATNNTHEFFCFYWTIFRSPIATKWVDSAYTNEIDPPWRSGKGVALKAGRRRALVVGFWRPTGAGEDGALVTATKGRIMDDVTTDELKDWKSVWQAEESAIRKRISEAPTQNLTHTEP